MINNDILLLIEGGNFEQAYKQLQTAISTTSLTPELLALSRKLSMEIRQECMTLACNKATDGSPKAFELDALLLEVIKINGEGIYG